MRWMDLGRSETSASTNHIIEGSLEAKLPTIWKDGNGTVRKKLGREESQEGEDKRWRRSEMKKVRREKMQVR